jgi:hypothetical protein
VVELPWAADSCPWVGKLRTVLPLTVGIRDSVVQLVLTHQRERTWRGADQQSGVRALRCCMPSTTYTSALHRLPAPPKRDERSRQRN